MVGYNPKQYSQDACSPFGLTVPWKAERGIQKIKNSNSAFNGKAAAAILLTPIAKRKKLIGSHLPGLFGYGPRPRNYGTVILTVKKFFSKLLYIGNDDNDDVVVAVVVWGVCVYHTKSMHFEKHIHNSDSERRSHSYKKWTSGFGIK